MGLLLSCVVGEDCSGGSSQGGTGGSGQHGAGGSGGEDKREDGGSGAPGDDSGVGANDAGVLSPQRDAGGSDGGSGPARTHTLSVSTQGGGMTSPAPGTYFYVTGTAVDVTAMATPGATFAGWSGASSGMTNPLSVTMDQDKSLVAHFSSSTYTLTLKVNGAGSGTTNPDAGSHTYAGGTSVEVTAVPELGSVFTGWSGASTGADNPLTLTMDQDKSLAATFAIDTTGLPARCPGTCSAAAITNPTVSKSEGLGNVTMSSTGASSGGSCGYGTTKVMYHAAINVNVQPNDGKGQWQRGRICGQCALVTALTSQGPKSVLVRIMDQCTGTGCGINLSGSAPGAVMLDGVGRYTGKWSFVSCAGHPEVSDGAPSLLVLGGSSRDWARVRIQNPKTSIDTIDWRTASGSASGSFPYATNPEFNAFEVPVNEVLKSTSSSMVVTVKYTDGSTATVQLSPAQLATANTAYPLQ